MSGERKEGSVQKVIPLERKKAAGDFKTDEGLVPEVSFVVADVPENDFIWICNT